LTLFWILEWVSHSARLYFQVGATDVCLTRLSYYTLVFGFRLFFDLV
jgi:hypothetical protein